VEFPSWLIDRLRSTLGQMTLTGNKLKGLVRS
jgi:hypothetical protein